MKWGVRRAIGNKAKIAANLERRADIYDAKSRYAFNKHQKLQTERLERMAKGDTSATNTSEKENRYFDKYVNNRKLSEKMEIYRKESVKDLSDKDIQQGRSYIAKASIGGYILGGPIGMGAVVGYDDVRANRFINELENKQRY